MIPRRIMGIETEYGIACPSNSGGPAPLDAEAAAALLFEPVIAAHRSTNTFLTNGSRLYLDVGAHPEYATVECDSIEDLLAYDRSGELLFADLARQANDKLAAQGIEGRIHLFKNNNDAEGNSFGCHENYLVRRRPDYRVRVASMLPFFVTRQIVAGAGHIYRDADGKPAYEFSQRADQMWDAISSASTRSRPMINTRDEPHGDAELYRRMHVIVGDSNMAQTSTAVKVGITELLLMMVEDGGILPSLELKDPVEAIRLCSKDLTARCQLELADGRLMSPLDIQRSYRDVLVAHLSRYELSPMHQHLLDVWTRALDALERQDLRAMAGELDWAAKLQLLDRYCERAGCDLDDPRVARLDLAYHDITSSLVPSLEASGGLARLISEDDARRAITEPPSTTRGALRGAFVAKAQALHQDYAVDWTNLRLMGAQGNSTVVLNDPFEAVSGRVDELMDQMC